MGNDACSLWHSRKLAAPGEYKTVTEHEAAAKPPAYHKLVQTAPDGGEVRVATGLLLRMSVRADFM